MKEKIIYKKVDELKLNDRNPRKNDGAVETIMKSINEFGFRNPLIIDADNKVWCGNTRLKAARKMGLLEVPCIVAEDLTEEQIRKLALLDNKTSEIAEWDYDLLSEELADLDLSEFELDWGIVQDDGFGTDFELPSGDQKYKTMTFTLSKDQEEFISNKISEIQKTEQFKEYQEYEFENKNRNGNALYLLLKGLDK